MKAPYYLGDTVPLIFKVTDAQGDEIPDSVSIKILKPDETKDETINGNIEGSTISCLIPAFITDEAGKYSVYFKMHLPNHLIRTHKMIFDILGG